MDEQIFKRSRRVVEVPSENHPFVFESRRNFASSSAGCQNIIGMEPALNAAMKVINRELVTSTTATGEHRKPPAVASRFSRGGKTTFLRCLYDRLELEGISPI